MTTGGHSPPRIQLDRVAFAYGNNTLLDQVSLEVGPGEAVGLLGGNGVGKSTVLKLLSGLLQPSNGAIHISGVSVSADRRRVRTLLGYVPDEPPLYDMMSAEENLNLFGVLWGVPRSTIAHRAQQLLEGVGLTGQKSLWVRAYSRGMRQRLALCAALIHRPQVLLLDEPFTGVDSKSSEDCRKLLRKFLDEGGAILAATHQPDHPALPFGRLLELLDGHLTAVGLPWVPPLRAAADEESSA